MSTPAEALAAAAARNAAINEHVAATSAELERQRAEAATAQGSGAGERTSESQVATPPPANNGTEAK